MKVMEEMRRKRERAQTLKSQRETEMNMTLPAKLKELETLQMSKSFNRDLSANNRVTRLKLRNQLVQEKFEQIKLKKEEDEQKMFEKFERDEEAKRKRLKRIYNGMNKMF